MNSSISQALCCCSTFHSGAHFPSEPVIEALSASSLVMWVWLTELKDRPLQLVTLGRALQTAWWEGCSQGCPLPGELLLRGVSSVLSPLELQFLLHPHLCLAMDLLVCSYRLFLLTTDLSGNLGSWLTLAAPSLGAGGMGPCPAGSLCYPTGF